MITASVSKYIKDFIHNNNATIASLNDQIIEIQSQIAVLVTDNQEALNCLQTDCIHQYSHKVSDMPLYFAGGTTENSYTIICSNCSKVLESKSIRGTYAQTF